MHPRNSPHLRRHLAGTSLPELLCVIVLLGIVTSLASPAMEQLIARHRLIAATNSLVTGLHYARHTAVVSGQPARLCPSSTDDHCAGNADWQHGWHVHASSRSTAAYNGSLPSKVSVHVGQGRQQVRFLPDGRSPGSNVTLHLCSHGKLQRQIVVSNAGRVRTTPITHTPCD